MKIVRNSLKVVVVAIILAAIDPTLIVLPFEFVWTLCFGWVYAAVRLATRLQQHTSGFLLWGLLFLTVGLGAQRFCKAIAADRHTGWKLRWTIAGFGGLWLSLTAAMAMIGIAHQIGWIAASGEPWASPNERERLTLAAALVSNTAQNGGWTADEIRRAVPVEWVNLVFQRDVTDNKITNVVVIHRDGRTGFVEVRRDGRFTRHPMNELTNALGLAAAK